MVYIATTSAPAQPANQATGHPTMSGLGTLDTALQAALEHARRLTSMFGTDCVEVAIAWDTVEELQSLKARRAAQQYGTPKAAFARYCAENPEAPEARIYDC